MHSFIISFNKYLLSVYYVPGAIWGVGDTALNNTEKHLCSYGVYILFGETRADLTTRQSKHSA